MTDILGPGSNATNVVTIRPADSRTFGASDTWMKDCSSPSAADGTVPPASWANALIAQLRTAIRNAGIADNNADDAMLWKAIQASPGNQRLFNVQMVASKTRTSYGSITGFQNFLSGTYVKKSATSNLLVRCAANLFSASGFAAGVGRVTGFTGTTITFVTSNSTGSSNTPCCTAEELITGLAAGSYSWVLGFGRNDANAWSSVVNPTSAADASGLPAATSTGIFVAEFEP